MEMRNGIVGILAAAAVAATGFMSAIPAHADTAQILALTQAQLQQKTDEFLFNVSIEVFLSNRAAQPYGDQLDWSSDGCSWAPDKPEGFNFLPSCQRHDFGYRNYKRQGRFNEDVRGKIDQNFKNDMYNVCNKYSGLESYKGVICRRTADTYYAAVRGLGGRADA
ncbi:phospholipase [Streptosporangium sp. NPDC087985]|uniref:phospholipase n=1 Tax=Streptosporangium sp. NPDC087985 TaxID=3366196 RepID=UPI00380CFC4B